MTHRPRSYRDSTQSPESSLPHPAPSVHARFEAAYTRYGRGIERFFHRRLPRRSEHVAELVQRTWAAVWQSMSAGRYDADRAKISTYVYAVAYKIWLQDLRQSGGRVAAESVDGLADRLLSGSEPVESAVHAAELLDALRICRDTVLSDDERAVIDATGRGTADRETGQLLGIAASTVHERRRRGLEKLRLCLQQKGFSQIEPERGGSLDE